MEYELIRSNRRTLTIKVNRDGILVKAPLTLSKREIENFVNSHSAWIEKQLKRVSEEEVIPKLKPAEKEAIRAKAKEILPERVKLYAKRLGLKYGNVTIRFQKSRWGCCTSKGNLSLNAMLVLLPTEVMDAIIVHELCHLKEMNHSERFYHLVRKAYPDYDKCNSWLKKNGHKFLSMID